MKMESANRLCFAAADAKAKIRSRFRAFITKENGEVNIVAIVILIAIAVVLAIAFRSQIAKLLGKLFAAIGGKADEINQDVSIGGI